jgi:hypothetical protein
MRVVERTCPSCGADPGAGSFCQHCGTRLSDEDAPAASGPQGAPESPTPAAPQPVQQNSKRRSGLRTGCLVAGLLALALVVIGAYFAWRFVSDEILPGIEETTELFEPLSESPPGPCYDLETDNGVLTDWTEVSCDGPRQVEVSFAALFEEGPFPGDDYLKDNAAETCLNAFETYVGISPDESEYDFNWLVPTESQWADGIRKGICLVVSDDGSTLTGTVKGSET